MAREEQSYSGAGEQCRGYGLSMNGLLQACHWGCLVKLKMKDHGDVRAGGAFW